MEDLYVLKQIDFSDLQVRENTPEYHTYRTLVNHLLEGLADIEEGKMQNSILINGHHSIEEEFITAGRNVF